jgi:hypothetical protein
MHQSCQSLIIPSGLTSRPTHSLAIKDRQCRIVHPTCRRPDFDDHPLWTVYREQLADISRFRRDCRKRVFSGPAFIDTSHGFEFAKIDRDSRLAANTGYIVSYCGWGQRQGRHFPGEPLRELE